jgi:hypothetical protein
MMRIYGPKNLNGSSKGGRSNNGGSFGEEENLSNDVRLDSFNIQLKDDKVVSH